MDADGRVVGVGDLKAQATQVYQNLAAVLAEAGCTLRDVVKFTTFLVRNEDWAPFAEWRKAEYPRALPRRRLPGEHGRRGEGAGAARAAPRGGGHRRAPRPPRGRGPGSPPARAARRRGPRRRAGPGAGVGDGPRRSARGRHGEVRLRAGAGADGRDTLAPRAAAGGDGVRGAPAARAVGARAARGGQRRVGRPTARCSATATR